MIPLRDDNPTTIRPAMTVGLIALNVLAFLYQISLGPAEGELFVYQYGAIPAVIFGSRSLPLDLVAIPASFTILTSMFLHGGFMHLIGNMLYLWIFGNNIEDAMGHGRFVVFYLIGGVAASLSHFLTDVTSPVPTIGASGAISAVLGAYILLYPRAQVLVLIPLGFFTRLMYIPAGFVLGFYFLLQLLQGTVSLGQASGGVAWFAHIGGFITGLLLVGLFKQRTVQLFNPPHYHARRIDHWRDEP
ncbi:MAG: rhomboid family intramembrane serine protease [Acidobacteria bacterium]|nr:rhomboid family intramembrane serine protease [Acidobacteriota bacterium]